MSHKHWTDSNFKEAVQQSVSIRQVLIRLGLRPIGGNYATVDRHIKRLSLSSSHFLGRGWNKGGTSISPRKIPLKDILVASSNYQSYKLKNRLFQSGLKHPRCELCDWHTRSTDGRVPVELDHINGNHSDNRIENLRILCPNCHSLQTTHRALNKRIG